MLTRLLVKNFLLIREAQLQFSPSLNVLTGETAAGKSILLGALGLALGARGTPGSVGPNGELLQVEAVFRADRATRKIADSMGIPIEGEELILRRQVHARGASRCFVNGHRVLLRGLRKLGANLVEIHGQRQEERFRIPEVQRDLLDLFGDHGQMRRRVRDLFREVRARRERLEEHRSRMARLTEEEEWTRFQLQEIEEIDPSAGEADEIRERVRSLRESQDRSEWLMLAEELLNGREGAVLESLETLDDRSGCLPSDGGQWAELRAEVQALLGGARQLYRALRRVRGELDEGVSELPVLEERLARLEGLQRKHRKPLIEILEAAGRMREGLSELEEAGKCERVLSESLRERQEALSNAVEELSGARRKAGVRLARALRRELSELAMKDCALRVALEPLPDSSDGLIALPSGLRAGPSGGERVRFDAETNAGAGFRPLGQIASGGEMARIALALRVVLGKRGRSLLTVFDEIDAGLGATAARPVAKRLQSVAQHRQVLLVTHLPVIAARAQRHFRVWKWREGRQTLATASEVSGGERVAEIARMLSGKARDPSALGHAEALLAETV